MSCEASAKCGLLARSKIEVRDVPDVSRWSGDLLTGSNVEPIFKGLPIGPVQIASFQGRNLGGTIVSKRRERHSCSNDPLETKSRHFRHSIYDNRGAYARSLGNEQSGMTRDLSVSARLNCLTQEYRTSFSITRRCRQQSSDRPATSVDLRQRVPTGPLCRRRQSPHQARNHFLCR